MMSAGSSFITSVRVHFCALFKQFAFTEVGAHDEPSFASLTARNATHYLRVTCDFRDRFVSASFGPLVEDVVPPVPIMPAREASQVREVPSGVILWATTGDKHSSFAVGKYDQQDEEGTDAAVARLAGALGRHGALILAGDRGAWTRAAELTVARQWRP